MQGADPAADEERVCEDDLSGFHRGARARKGSHPLELPKP